MEVTKWLKRLIGQLSWLWGLEKNMQFRRSPGFTLIEVIMVVFILGVTVVAGGSLFFSIMKGATKAELNKEVKQNGNYAQGVMERMIRSARSIKDCSSSSLKIENQDSGLTTFRCDEALGVAQLASISGDIGSVGGLTGQNVTLNPSASTCAGSSLDFTCNLTSTPPRVSFSFTLYQKGTSERPEEQAQDSFKTTILLRTY